MEKLTADKYRELFRLRAIGELEIMECTKSLFNLLEPLYFKGVKILDLPCGVGHYFRKLKDLGEIKYIGADLDEKALKIAIDVWKEYSNATFEVQNAKNLTFESNYFDIVFCYNLLLHLDDYIDVVRELFRVSNKYILIRSLFDEIKQFKSIKVGGDYREIYETGLFYYNTYARDDVRQFIENLGSCKIKFLNDNIAIPEESIRKQQEMLNVKSEEFTKAENGKKQEWKGLELNYEVLIIEKE